MEIRGIIYAFLCFVASFHWSFAYGEMKTFDFISITVPECIFLPSDHPMNPTGLISPVKSIPNDFRDDYRPEFSNRSDVVMGGSQIVTIDSDYIDRILSNRNATISSDLKINKEKADEIKQSIDNFIKDHKNNEKTMNLMFWGTSLAFSRDPRIAFTISEIDLCLILYNSPGKKIGLDTLKHMITENGLLRKVISIEPIDSTQFRLIQEIYYIPPSPVYDIIRVSKSEMMLKYRNGYRFPPTFYMRDKYDIIEGVERHNINFKWAPDDLSDKVLSYNVKITNIEGQSIQQKTYFSSSLKKGITLKCKKAGADVTSIQERPIFVSVDAKMSDGSIKSYSIMIDSEFKSITPYPRILN